MNKVAANQGHRQGVVSLSVYVGHGNIAQPKGFLNRTGNLYVECVIIGEDGRRQSHKTLVQCKTWEPRWHETFNFTVTPYARLEVRAFNHHLDRSDSLLGTGLMSLYDLLATSEGKLDKSKVEVKLQDMNSTVGAVNLKLSSSTVNMADFPPPNWQLSRPPVAPSNIVQEPREVSQQGLISLEVLVDIGAFSRPEGTLQYREREANIYLECILHDTDTSGRVRPQSRKTSVQANTWEPRWRATLKPYLVSPYARLEVRAFNHHLDRVDFLLGNGSLSLYDLLCGSNGKLDDTSVRIELFNTTNSSKTIALVGLQLSSSPPVNMSEFPPRASRPTVQFQVATPSAPSEPEEHHAIGGGKVPRESSDTTEGPLPPYWEQCTSDTGAVYYLDRLTNTTHWERPAPLPQGWERKVDQYGRVYYLDHTTRSTTWQLPSAALLGHVNEYREWRQSQATRMEYLYRAQTDQLGVLSPAPRPEDFEEGDASATGFSLGPLPDGWERRVDESNREYFVNHKNRISQWDDPRTQGLPPGWARRWGQDGNVYFVNHTSQVVTAKDPRDLDTGQKSAQFTFERRLAQFRYLCHCNGVKGYFKNCFRRDNLLKDSFDAVMGVQKASFLRCVLWISFAGEEGLDYGGVAREWFFTLSQELLNPMYCLFQYASSNNYALQINPASGVNPEHLEYFEFVGRFMAMALYHGKFISTGFSLPFYKYLLGKKLTLKDLEAVDQEVFASLKDMMDMSPSDIEALELYFMAEHEELGIRIETELKPGGKDLQVTAANLEEYVELYARWRCLRGVQEQTKAIMKGFNAVVPLDWLSFFDEKELQFLLCGIHEIDVKDWERNTIYRTYVASSQQVLWFWQLVREMSNEDRSKLLQFVTGTCRVPPGGFKDLIGSNGPQQFCIEKLGTSSALPRSHTCFNRLDLPAYETFNTLKEKVMLAIQETEGFGLE